MRASLLVLGVLAATSVAAQEAPADSAAGRPASGAADSVATSRTARLALPTQGGVFYYRAGAGQGVLQRRTILRDTAVDVPARRAALAASAPARPTPEASGVAPQALAQTGGRTDGVTQRDLDRLETRLLSALDRRLADLDRQRAADAPRRDGAVVVVPVVPRASGETPRDPTPYREVPITNAPPVQVASPRVPAPAPEAIAPTVEQIERDILDTGLFRTTFVNFEFARAELLPLSESTLDAVATVLLRYPDLRIEVGGHTDSVGSDQTNDRLSGERAGAVAAYLVASGVAPDRLRAVGFGERQPVASNDSETGRALNRRVEFVVLNPGAGQRLR